MTVLVSTQGKALATSAYFGLIRLIESCNISKLVMHLNSCSMDLGCDSVGIDPRKSASHICTIPTGCGNHQGLLCGVVSLSPHGITGLALIPYVTTQGKALATSALYLKRTSHN